MVNNNNNIYFTAHNPNYNHVFCDRMVQKAAKMYEGRLQAGEADYNAWNQAGVHTVLAAKVSIIALVIRSHTVRYPVHWTAESSLHFTLADLGPRL